MAYWVNEESCVNICQHQNHKRPWNQIKLIHVDASCCFLMPDERDDMFDYTCASQAFSLSCLLVKG